MTAALVTFFIRIVTAGAVAQGMLFAFRKHSAAVRHLIATAGLVAILLLAASTKLTRDIPERRFSTPIMMERANHSFAETTVLEGDAPREAPISSVTYKPSLARLTVIGWRVGSAILILRIVVSFASLRRRVRRATPLNSAEDSSILIDSQATTPVMAWWGTSKILLPKEAEEWSAERLESVLCHERAHISRFDWWWNLVGLVACALAWPNPLVWMLHRQERELSELAADDIVLRSGVPASEYAQQLLQIAAAGQSKLENLALPMATQSHISRRIHMLLNQKQTRGAASLAAIISVATLQLAVVAGLGSWALVTTLPMSKHQLFQATKAEATVKEKWYLVDKDAFGKFASNSQNAQLTGLDAQEVSQKLEAGHAQMLRQFSSVLPVAMIIPKGDTSIISDKEKVGRLELKSGAQYIEGMKLYSEMVSCKLDVGQKGSLNHMTTALTIALGSDTVGSLAQGKQLLCVIAPSIGSRQLVITHSFEEKVPRR